MFEFATETLGMTPAEILNHYRNKYYTEPLVTERGIVANAINDVLPNMVEVVHAEWKCDSDDDQYDGEYYCSECNAEEYIPDNTIFPPFCWHCGAKMDGGKRLPTTQPRKAVSKNE